ncbi:SMC family ATPase [Jatrophihabitans telluris]|uniref:Nuclease SbcCD subunit C n=1 Tax=Jatrophihabitans telluris TaxID=2038343 RepID=A0ABY4QY71_9ACTN|nr:SMC family ATPase [Jatrophihabitans telluris]UQX87834.1 SMC family ATPase [Jatrophihabitans telluris]
MRLHRLRLRAIGPFADDVELDFTELGQRGLFLLEGPTGSGKSTIIDAISFALYGRVAQASASAERLHSHHAAPGVEPMVELTFETGNGVYRIRRTPSYERPKRDGSGTRKINATVKIFKSTSPDHIDRAEPLSTRMAEADDEVLLAVGLNHEQFVQTMVLPQGEFAKFLQSRTEDKKALLQRLFGTELIAATQQELLAARQQAELQRAGGRVAVERAASSFAGSVGMDEAACTALDEAVQAGDAEVIIALVASTKASVEQAEAVRHSEQQAAVTWRCAALEELTAARDLAGRRARRAQLRARMDELESGAEATQAAEHELEAAENAVLVAPSAEALADAVAALAAARTADDDARAGLAAPLRRADSTELTTAAAEVRERIGALADDILREQHHDALAGQLAAANARAAELDSVLTRAASTLAELPGRLAEHRDQRDRSVAAQAEGTRLAAELSRARTRYSAAMQARAAADRAAFDEQITQTTLTALLDQESRLTALRSTRMASIAGELGLALQHGHECAVCGSVEHPRPARPRADHVSEQVLSSAEDELGRLRTAAEKAQGELHRQQTELAALRTAADQLSPEQAQAKVSELEQTLSQVRTVAERLGEAEGAIAETQETVDELTERLRQAEVERATLAERTESWTARMSEDAERLAVARAGFDTVTERRDELMATAARLGHAAEAAAALAEVVRQAAVAGQRFAAVLGESGFADEASWAAATRSRQARAALREHIAQHRQSVAAVLTQLSEPELNDPRLDADAADLAPLEATLAAAESAVQAAEQALGSARSLSTTTTRQATILTRAIADNAGVLAATSAAIRLGQLVAGNGDNQLKMELTTYVLIRRFAEVLDAANAQLRHIAGGRYTLEHTDARSGNTRSGLGLRVLDIHTGQARDPATLSGGETFYVSLALALGLADVVRSEAGGVDLGTLFVDEGFGSLDADALDEVLGVLDTLRSGGRAVGVVSHVSEMKARIADRIEVRVSTGGRSRLRVVA